MDTIMKPYFRTRSMVLVLTLFFLYIAIVLTYLIGNYIVNPLLFLRMNVRKISDILTTMIRGQARVTSSSLVYIDCVQSHDEIKALSTEINDMVTVIRGIVPYISASTLKQAEKGIASTTKKELTFLFTDIRGFTTLCEGMSPEEVVGVLNRYLDLETEIILSNHGDVDKFVGDEMMAFFEGPLKEENACRAAMQIRHAMMEEKERREKEGMPVVSIGIGINTGNVVFGSVGARDRMDFTSIGDTVNLAARLEGANKAYGSKSIITEAVYEKVKDIFLCRELDFIAVKGKNEPVRIFEILQESLTAQPKLIDIKESFEKGLAAYRARKWKDAHAAFKKGAELYKDAPAQVYIERVEHFMQNPPPADWDGVFRMTVK
jgi:class 3 adenylate cyclase